MDGPLGQVSSEQRLGSKIVAPYLREQLGIGIRSVYRVALKPNKDVTPTDTQYNFTLPSLGDAVIDLSGIHLRLGGRLLRRRSDGTYGSLVDCSASEKEDALVILNTLYSLFSDVKVYLGRNQVSTHLILVCYCISLEFITL